MLEQIKNYFFSQKKRPSQKDRILNLLKKNKGKWVSVVDIMRLRPKIANHTARITELKQKWHQIFNKTKWVKEWPNVVKYSKYMLTNTPDEK